MCLSISHVSPLHIFRIVRDRKQATIRKYLKRVCQTKTTTTAKENIEFKIKIKCIIITHEYKLKLQAYMLVG